MRDELHAKWWAAGDVRPVVGHEFTLDMVAQIGVQFILQILLPVVFIYTLLRKRTRTGGNGWLTSACLA